MIGILLIPIGLAVVLLIAAYEGKFGLSIDPKVRISDGFTVICTTILALALQYFFARRNIWDKYQQDRAADAIEVVLSSLQELRESVSETVADAFPTPQQAQKIIYGFECCGDALLMLELAFDGPNQYRLKECGDLAGQILASKRQITGDDFPKRKTSYADVQLLSSLKRDFARRLNPLTRMGLPPESLFTRCWRQLKSVIEADRAENAEWWK